MTTTFWRDPAGSTWAHLSEIRDAARRYGSDNWREWENTRGAGLGSSDALVAIGLDRREIAADLNSAVVVRTTNPNDQIVVFGHKSKKTVGTGLVEVVIVPSSHPTAQPGATRPRSLGRLLTTNGDRLAMTDLRTLLENW